MSKYNKMKAFHEQCIEDLKSLYEERIEDLKKEVDHWRSRACENSTRNFSNSGKIEIYEKILSKFLDGPSKYTDSVIVFEGKTYIITGFTLNHNEGETDTLTVDCTRVNLPG